MNSQEEKHKAYKIAEKLIKFLKANRQWENSIIVGVRGNRLTTENFTNMSFNHVFDDAPERYEMSLHDTHVLRAFLSNTNEGGNDENLAYWKGFFALLDMEEN